MRQLLTVIAVIWGGWAIYMFVPHPFDGGVLLLTLDILVICWQVASYKAKRYKAKP